MLPEFLKKPEVSANHLRKLLNQLKVDLTAEAKMLLD